MIFWSFLSALGGLDITAPLAIAIAAWLAGARSLRLALSWCLLLGAAFVVAAGSQMAFLGWGVGIETLAFTGFSGHATRAAAVFPTLLFLLLGHRPGWQRSGAVLAGGVLAVGVAIARVKVGAHSPSEVIAGCGLGLATAALFMMQARAIHIGTSTLRSLVVCGAAGLLTALFLLQRDEPVDAHQWLTAAALQLSGQDRVYQRAGWQRAAEPYVPPCAPARVRFHYLCS